MFRDNLFYLNFTSKTQKCTNFIAFRPLLTITDLNKFRMFIFGHSKFLPVFLYQKGFNKFGMHIFGHSEFLPVFLGKIVRKHLEWPFLAILNLYQSFWEKLSEEIWNGHFWPFQISSENFSVHITLIESNGFESNEICTFLAFHQEI